MSYDASAYDSEPKGARLPLIGPVVARGAGARLKADESYAPVPPLRIGVQAGEAPAESVATETADTRTAPLDVSAGNGLWPAAESTPAAPSSEVPVEAQIGEPFEDSGLAEPLYAPEEALPPIDDYGDADWLDEVFAPALGEAAPEDELTLGDVDSVADRASPSATADLEFADKPADARAEQPYASQLFELSAEKVEEVADRLEKIARTLRERGTSDLSIEYRTDPLGALITGYLAGFAERTRPGDQPPSG